MSMDVNSNSQCQSDRATGEESHSKTLEVISDCNSNIVSNGHVKNGTVKPTSLANHRFGFKPIAQQRPASLVESSASVGTVSESDSGVHSGSSIHLARPSSPYRNKDARQSSQVTVKLDSSHKKDFRSSSPSVNQSLRSSSPSINKNEKRAKSPMQHKDMSTQGAQGMITKMPQPKMALLPTSSGSGVTSRRPQSPSTKELKLPEPAVLKGTGNAPSRLAMRVSATGRVLKGDAGGNDRILKKALNEALRPIDKTTRIDSKQADRVRNDPSNGPPTETTTNGQARLAALRKKRITPTIPMKAQQPNPGNSIASTGQYMQKMASNPTKSRLLINTDSSVSEPSLLAGKRRLLKPIHKSFGSENDLASPKTQVTAWPVEQHHRSLRAKSCNPRASNNRALRTGEDRNHRVNQENGHKSGDSGSSNHVVYSSEPVRRDLHSLSGAAIPGLLSLARSESDSDCLESMSGVSSAGSELSVALSEKQRKSSGGGSGRARPKKLSRSESDRLLLPKIASVRRSGGTGGSRCTSATSTSCLKTVKSSISSTSDGDPVIQSNDMNYHGDDAVFSDTELGPQFVILPVEAYEALMNELAGYKLTLLQLQNVLIKKQSESHSVPTEQFHGVAGNTELMEEEKDVIGFSAEQPAYITDRVSDLIMRPSNLPLSSTLVSCYKEEEKWPLENIRCNIVRKQEGDTSTLEQSPANATNCHQNLKLSVIPDVTSSSSFGLPLVHNNSYQSDVVLTNSVLMGGDNSSMPKNKITKLSDRIGGSGRASRGWSRGKRMSTQSSVESCGDIIGSVFDYNDDSIDCAFDVESEQVECCNIEHHLEGEKESHNLSVGETILESGATVNHVSPINSANLAAPTEPLTTKNFHNLAIYLSADIANNHIEGAHGGENVILDVETTISSKEHMENKTKLSEIENFPDDSFYVVPSSSASAVAKRLLRPTQRFYKSPAVVANNAIASAADPVLPESLSTVLNNNVRSSSTLLPPVQPPPAPVTTKLMSRLPQRAPINAALVTSILEAAPKVISRLPTFKATVTHKVNNNNDDGSFSTGSAFVPPKIIKRN